MATTTNGSILKFGTSNAWASGVPNMAMTIIHDGKIGIGTTAPDSLLTVNGFIHAKGVLVDFVCDRTAKTNS